MAGTTFQIKRTGVAGRQPNTTNQSNSAYIEVGELALNFADGILYSSNGSALIELGANVENQNITGTLTANGSVGTNGQLLLSNGNGIYWGTLEGGLLSVSTDDTIDGDGTVNNPLSIAFALINIDTRNANTVAAKLTRLLEVYFRYDDSFREATVFKRDGSSLGIIPN